MLSSIVRPVYAIILMAAFPRLIGAQLMARPPVVLEPVLSHFQVAPEAGQTLHAIWASSVVRKQERVACIGGELVGGVTRITRVLALNPSNADSLGISAAASIETCRPPDWFGTAHTHVALYDGAHPYRTFSGADRGVMMMWWKRWNVDGTFCVLYSEQAAHCEVDGPEPNQIWGPETAASY